MREHQSEKHLQTPWYVPVAVDDIAESGQQFTLVADAGVRADVARLAGLRDLARFTAKLDVRRRGAGGLHVTGRVSATVGQSCVVTLEPLTNEVEEELDLVFMAPAADAGQIDQGSEEELHEVKWDTPEPLIGGVVDLGALATEFLILGLDPYPRKPGAAFEPLVDAKPDDGPFAVLASLKGRNGG
jgi:hypothetical protein